jgi:hypothetical protein
MDNPHDNTQFPIVYHSNNLDEINLITNVNRKDIYKIKIDNCLSYIVVGRYTTYIAIFYKNVLHVFNLKNNGEFPEDLKTQITEKINISDINNIIMKRYRYKTINMKDTLLYIKNLIWIYISECSKVINLEEAQNKVDKLNERLNETCPNFRISIDYIFGLPNPSKIKTYDYLVSVGNDAVSLLLCLFHDNNCVSSLIIKINDKEVSIDSYTQHIYRGRNYNKLLRAVIIIIAKLLNKKIKYVTSAGANPISTFQMKYIFNAKLPNSLETKIRESIQNSEDIQYKDIIKNIIEDEYNNTDLVVDSAVKLNDDNIQNAINVFDETIKDINCSVPSDSNSYSSYSDSSDSDSSDSDSSDEDTNNLKTTGGKKRIKKRIKKSKITKKKLNNKKITKRKLNNKKITKKKLNNTNKKRKPKRR